MRTGIVASARHASGPPSPVQFKRLFVDPVNRVGSYTVTAEPIGPASATRRVVVGVTTSSARTITGGTFGGVTATIDHQIALTGTARIAILSAIVPTGLTADLTVTLDGTPAYMGFAVWTLDGYDPTGQVSNDTGSPIDIPVTTSVGDVVISIAHNTGDNSSVFGWSGTNDRGMIDTEAANESFSAADVIAVGTPTTIAVTTVTGNEVGLSVAYG